MSQLWVFVESLAEGSVVPLATEETRHVVSRRLRIGDTLTAFDGQGRSATATLTGLQRKSAEIEVGSVDLAPAPEERFGLATAIPKGDRLSTMLQMWTQLGLTVWQPLVCEDSAIRNFDPGAARVRRILLESCKVARRPWMLRVLPPQSIEEAIASRTKTSQIFFADRRGGTAHWSSGQNWVFVGPEAGFSRTEFDALAAGGATAVSLGEYNLRIETAGVAAIAVFNGSVETAAGAGSSAL